MVPLGWNDRDRGSVGGTAPAGYACAMTRRRWFALLLVPVLLAACGSTGPTSQATSGPPAASQGSSAPSGQASPPAGSTSPGESTTPGESAAPAESPTPSESASAAPSASPGAADACTVANDSNRQVFVAVAAGVDWPVLCAVLPSGWTFQGFHYSLRSGGSINPPVHYTKGSRTLDLYEGAFCTTADGCVPPGTETTDAALGPLTGTFVRLDDGGFAIVVDRGASPSWLLVAHGIGGAKTRAFGEAVVEVAG